jgi:hypothetical protein
LAVVRSAGVVVVAVVELELLALAGITAVVAGRLPQELVVTVGKARY